MIDVYKIFNVSDSLNSGRHFVRNVGVTRGHSFKVFKERVSLDVRRYKFGNRVFGEWNLLTDDVLSAGSLDTLKRDKSIT